MSGVSLRPLPRTEVASVHHLELPEVQMPFAGRMTDITVGDPEDVDYHAVEAEDAVIGFFKIDTAYRERLGFGGPEDLGFRFFLIDHRYQGRGYAKAVMAALPDYLRQHYPGRSVVWLTVNLKNHRAYQIYLSAGWEDTGDQYEGGPSGPQHVMRLSLD
ncbi:GNAT family N-acetyltransferase [Pelagovum pacificum]|uniref:GNAT family N-acetyltransferase n=1 Tax=Pelagovum pacificum TaxID=2588711 RepID=A0A5C5GB07_9RHOB|nr:GNAT family N-acetyltransferase [Pelagovum pacificum]QQA41801.1 GNAT family N-acetyltransferase [Pelagovum pacificum]TNY30757.1 GNAT family N-acetyltransferase [Pelagovum pacificum]